MILVISMINILTLTRPDLDAMETEAVESVRDMAYTKEREIDCHGGALSEGETVRRREYRLIGGWCGMVLEDRKATAASVKGARGVMSELDKV